MVTAARLPQLQEPLDATPRNAQATTVGLSVQGQGLDSMILLPPSQLSPFCSSHPWAQPLCLLQALAELLGPGQERDSPSVPLSVTPRGLIHGIWPRLKKDRRWDGRSPFGPPGQLAKREQPGTGNEEERRRVSIPAAGKGDVQVGV
ncbi:hypothetical protein DUI87_26102 [Hirundo rustica rustica]|uniref:Uncharacterized protein n=1 Tax=Hirundo rustica rustica TaxID=333673 RepID=A0A3M0J935_HIRRU|nr:hypothetical protein DUI87_26102 [Hirundo rustica rustica]